jgi:pSer/pThr/pTyr-binding forkhead associated (FHA) protein
MPAKLLYRDAQGRDASVDVVPDGAFLGRAADCVVRTDDAMVSRKNCKISFSGGRWVVEDLGSSNGTFVNEVRVQKQILNHADVVRCGTLQVRFVEVAEQPMAQKPRTMSMQPQSVQVDPGLTGGGPLDGASLLSQKDAELQSVVQQLRDAQTEAEALRTKQQADAEELQRLRKENVTSRDRMKDMERQKSMSDDELHAQTKVAEEMRQELSQIKEEFISLKQRSDEMTDDISAKERQIERAQEDLQRAKQGTEDLRNKIATLEKTKDDGVRAMNQTNAELEHLREVINEQERILEERRVGLMSLEAQTKDVRADKEKTLREMVAIKSERDDLRDKVIKQNATIEALEEEHRRLARAISEGGGAASAVAGEEQHRMMNELRELKVEVKKLESDRQRMMTQIALAEADRKMFDEKMAQAEVERSHLLEEKAAGDSQRARAADSVAKSETARQRAEEANSGIAKERDAARAELSELRRKLSDTEDDLRRAKASAGVGEDAAVKQAVDDLQKARAEAKKLDDELKKMKTTTEALDARVLTAEGKAARLEEELKKAHAELQSARMGQDDKTHVGGADEGRVRELEQELAKLGSELAAAKSAVGSGAGAAAAGGVGVQEIKQRAEEAYTGINDALSELRTNLLLAKDTLAEHNGSLAGDAQKTLSEAVDIAVERMEDAKGLLRQLREVIEN